MTEFAGILHGAGRNEQKKLNWVVNNVESGLGSGGGRDWPPEGRTLPWHINCALTFVVSRTVILFCARRILCLWICCSAKRNSFGEKIIPGHAESDVLRASESSVVGRTTSG